MKKFKSISKLLTLSVILSSFGLPQASAAITGLADTVTITNNSRTVLLGDTVTSTFGVATTGTIANADTITYSLAITTQPTSGVALVDTSAGNAASGELKFIAGESGTADGGNWAAAAGDGADSTKIIDTANGAGALTVAMFRGKISLTPAVAGNYTITLTATPSVGAARTATMTVVALAKATGASTLGCSVSLEGNPAASSCTGQVGGQVKVFFSQAAAGTYYVSASNATILSVSDVEGVAGAAATVAASAKTNTLTYADGWTATVAANNLADDDYYLTTLTATAAGTTAFTVKTVAAATGAITTYDTMTITWATSSSLDPSSGNSKSILEGTTLTAAGADTQFTAGTDEVVIASGLTAGTLVGVIKVQAKDGNANLLADGKTIVAVVTGAGMAGGTATDKDTYANSSRYEAVTIAGGTGLAYFGVYADGTAGKSTITIMSGTTTLATETVVFHGRPAKVTVTQGLFVATKAGGAFGDGTANPSGATPADTPAATIAITDSLGLPVSGQTIVATSDNLLVVSGIAAQAESDGTDAGDGYAGEGTYNVSLTAVAAASGAKSNVTFKVADGITAGVYISAAPVTYTLGGGVATVAMSTDKASYAPGEKGTLTLTAKDSSGNPVADATYANMFAAAVAGSTSFGGSFPGVSVATSKGVKTYTFYAPVIGGTYTINGTTGISDANAPATVTASIKVADANASLLTQIDALNAKIVALNALIAKIMKKLGVK